MSAKSENPMSRLRPDAHERWPIRLREWWIEMVLRHHRAILAIGLLVTLVAGWLAAKLELDSDLRVLLPTDHPVVVAIDHVERNFGAVGSINVVLRGGTEEGRHAFADALDEVIEGDDMLREVDHRFGGEFFIEHALYYLPEPDMRELSELVAAWQHYEFCSAAPDVCVDDPDPEAATKLQAFIDRERAEVRERTNISGYYEREGIDATVVFLRPNDSSANLDFAVAVTERMQERVDAVFAREVPGPGPG
ncbi:MAG: hypothetical protein HC927_07755 [Deltaproteobacteria bacterium]|nr:hypothetical protein [Deltaproteobacteria bacterium]